MRLPRMPTEPTQPAQPTEGSLSGELGPTPEPKVGSGLLAACAIGPTAPRRASRYHLAVDLPSHPVDLPERVRDFLAGPHYAALATVGSDGAPHQAFIWYRLDEDDAIVVNSREGRRWPADLRRDGRVALAIADVQDQNRWVGLSAEVEAIDDDTDRARDEIVGLAYRYAPVEGDPDPESLADFRRQARVTFRLRITAVHAHFGDD